MTNHTTFYTKKLFYKKYPYKVTISRTIKLLEKNDKIHWTINNCRKWFLDNNINDYKVYKQQRYLYSKSKNKKRPLYDRSKCIMRASLFLKTKDTFDAFISRYEKDIVDITLPYDDNHIEVLENDTSIQIRKNLLYRKYRYVIKFKSQYHYTHYWMNRPGPSDILFPWITDNFIKTDKEYKWDDFIYSPKLYLVDESDLMFVKLSLSDEIAHILEIKTFDELKV